MRPIPPLGGTAVSFVIFKRYGKEQTMSRNITLQNSEIRNTSPKEKRSKLSVAAYARISTEEDSTGKGSYENQREYFENEILKHEDWTFFGIYGDYAKSGCGVKGRSGFKMLLDEAKKGNINIILTKSISRFSRNTADFIEAVRQLNSVRTNVIFLEEGIETLSANGELILAALSSVAEMESMTISQNLQITLKSLNEMGTPSTPSRFGYVKNGTSWSIVSEEAYAVKTAFCMFASGKKYSEIAAELNSLCHNRLPSGKKTAWKPRSVKNLLLSENYIGDIYTNKTATVITDKGKSSVPNIGIKPRYYISNHHPAVIGRETFALTCRLISISSHSDEKAKASCLSQLLNAAENDILLSDIIGKYAREAKTC